MVANGQVIENLFPMTWYWPIVGNKVAILLLLLTWSLSSMSNDPLDTTSLVTHVHYVTGKWVQSPEKCH